LRISSHFPPMVRRWRAYRASRSIESIGDCRPGAGPPRPDSPEAAGAFAGSSANSVEQPPDAPVSMPERQHHVRGGDHRGRPASETPEARAESRRSPQGSPRCHATTRAGGACLVRVEPSKARCRFHGGPSTGPRIEEGRARIAEAQRRRSRLSGQRVHQISWRLSAWADRLLLTHWRPLVRLLDVGYPRLVARRNRTSEFAKRMSESGV
jgi:hypothetical protein